MTEHDRDPSENMLNIDWDAPEMRALLERTASLHLDQRGSFEPRPVLLRRAWNESAPARDAAQVGERGDGRVTLLTAYSLDADEPVMVDMAPKLHSGVGRTLFEVESCHPGLRAQDHDRTVYVVVLRPAQAHIGAV